MAEETIHLDPVGKRLTFLEAVRTRPSMYFGAAYSQGLDRAAWNFILAVIYMHMQEDVTTSIKIIIKDDFTLQIQANLVPTFDEVQRYLDPEISQVDAPDPIDFVACVTAASKSLEIVSMNLSSQLMQAVFIEGVYDPESISTLTIQPAYNFAAELELDQVVFNEEEALSFSSLFGLASQHCATNESLAIDLFDERTNRNSYIVYSKGLETYLQETMHGSGFYHSHGLEPFRYKKQYGKESAEFAVAPRWTGGKTPFFINFVNGERMFDSGFHVEGFQHGLTECLDRYISEQQVEIERDILIDELADYVFAVSVWVDDVQFEGAIRSELITPIAKKMAYEVVLEAYENAFDQFKLHLRQMMWRLKDLHE